MQVLRDLAVPSNPPDVIFDDPSFMPLSYGAAASLSSTEHGVAQQQQQQQQQQLLQLLGSWSACSTDADALLRLLRPLLALYAAYQRQRLAQLHDERLQFELSMLDATGCSEVMLTEARDASDRRACFALPVVDVDLACVAAAWPYLQPQQAAAAAAAALSSSSEDASGTVHTEDVHPAKGSVADVEVPGQFKLHVAFRVGPSAAHTTPELHLQVRDTHGDCCLP